MADLSFKELRKANVERCHESFHPVEDWSPTDWACALAGEVGEACHVVKRMRRGELTGGSLADELADIVIYADLMAERCDINLGDAIRRKFNETSEKVGSTVEL
jgi:NTP pyrophosphatase (non-canonical NTP hydrolase)